MIVFADINALSAEEAASKVRASGGRAYGCPCRRVRAATRYANWSAAQWMSSALST